MIDSLQRVVSYRDKDGFEVEKGSKKIAEVWVDYFLGDEVVIHKFLPYLPNLDYEDDTPVDETSGE